MKWREGVTPLWTVFHLYNYYCGFVRNFGILSDFFEKKAELPKEVSSDELGGLENFEAAVALNFAYYNFCKIHGAIRCTPAMAACVESSQWSVAELMERCGE